MINLFKPYVSPLAHERVAEVLSSGQLTQGSVSDEFEKRVQEHVGDNAVLLNSGTSALELAYYMSGVRPFSTVISTPMTCFATNAWLVRNNVNVLWSDVNMITGLTSLFSIYELILKHPEVSHIVVVDWGGADSGIGKIRSLLARMGREDIVIIEDAAHRWDSMKVSPRHRGDYVIYSLQAIKFLTAGDGGVLVVPEDQYARARLLRWFGLDRDNNQSFRSTQDIAEAGFKFHMNNINAAIGLSNIDGVEDRVRKQTQNALDILSDTGMKAEVDSQFWFLPMLVQPGTRKDFIAHALAYGVEANVVHSRNDKMSCARGGYDRRLAGLDMFSECQINLPCGWWLEDHEIERICEVIRKWDKFL